MDKLVEWLTKNFQHPFSLLFFLFGVLLMLLGLTTGFEIPLLKQLAPATNFQDIALAAGFGCLVVSLILYYKPAAKKAGKDETQKASQGFIVQSQTLSKNQREILSRIALQKSMLFGDIHKCFTEFSASELFYRLEQLRLMGFITVEAIGAPNDTSSNQIYRLSPGYSSELVRLETDFQTPEGTPTGLMYVYPMRKKSQDKKK